MTFAILLALTGLTLSAVAIYYSVIGLTAVFAASFWAVAIMGTTLEIAKLVAASWLKAYWEKIPRGMKFYMSTAVVVLMLITSMGIFGFLSKAHLDQNIISGDVQSKIAIIDEKIQTEKDNIDAARKALAQMDAQVNERLSRSTDDKGAERAVQIRRQQQAERTRLQNDISKAQSNISKLNEEAAPVRAEVRKVEAEVGPIKYIAKLIYGDNPDANILEKAVTWVIMIIVFVFDPLAVLMLLGAQMTYRWYKEEKAQSEEMASDVYELNNGKDWLDEQVDDLNKAFENHQEEVKEKNDPHPVGWMFPRHADIQSYRVEDADEEEQEPTKQKTNEEINLDQWNKLLEEAEKAVEAELQPKKNEFPENAFIGQQVRIETEEGAKDYVFNGSEWIFTPVSKHHAEIDPVAEAKKWAEEQQAEEESKKKTTYIIKEGDQQVQKIKD